MRGFRVISILFSILLGLAAPVASQDLPFDVTDPGVQENFEWIAREIRKNRADTFDLRRTTPSVVSVPDITSSPQTFTSTVTFSSATVRGNPTTGTNIAAGEGAEYRWIKMITTATWPTGSVLVIEAGSGSDAGYYIAVTTNTSTPLKPLVVLKEGPAGAAFCVPAEVCLFQVRGPADYVRCNAGTAIGQSLVTDVTPGEGIGSASNARSTNGIVLVGESGGICTVALFKGY